MKATEAAIRRALLKYNVKAQELKASEYELDVTQKDVGNQQRHKYALTNGKGHHITAYVSGITMLYYLEGILKGICISKSHCGSVYATQTN